MTTEELIERNEYLGSIWPEWVIDTAMSRKNLLCFSPIDRGTVVEKAMVVGKPPMGARCIGVYHPQGGKAANKWLDKNLERALPFLTQ